MKEELHISLIQFDSIWEDKYANMRRAENLIKNTPFAPEVVIFPEMFLTGFSMNVSAVSETMDGEMVRWMNEIAKTLNSYMIGSLPIEENGKYFNRLLITSPADSVFYYDKRHLFRMGEENQHYSGGNTRKLFKLKEWSLLPLVCYDLRFPVWSRNRDLEYNILIYVANWPASRNDAFISLLKARAIENSCYVIGVNRVGTDGNKIQYIGNSVVYDPKGKILAGMIEGKETVINVTLSLDELNTYRNKFPVHMDGDNFEIII